MYSVFIRRETSEFMMNITKAINLVYFMAKNV